MVFRSVRSEDKSLKLYEGLYHEIFNEYPPDRARVFGDMSAWIASRIVNLMATGARWSGAERPAAAHPLPVAAAIRAGCPSSEPFPL